MEATDGVGEPSKVILQEFKRYAKEAGLIDEHKQALRKLLVRKDWTFQFWVLPQRQRKMYRFPNGGGQGSDGLVDFLSEERVRKGGELARALYMEAHLVPLEHVAESEEEMVGEGSKRPSRKAAKVAPICR